ncbi:hypothetical protein SAMN05444354_12693 [Stigmatella aurantiaca]|uniref:Uncharacterized protein n=1 Tax=Stigmatella aurantiaca TaxID=41 RepID=A0A1H8CIT2_STIAU|nr:hypothetical protein SAMN05444354_12693 [Stigmatella aurantiaca]
MPVIGVKMCVCVRREVLQEGAPGLLTSRGPDGHLCPAQPLLQQAHLIGLLRVLGPLREQGPSFFSSRRSTPWCTTLSSRSTSACMGGQRLEAHAAIPWHEDTVRHQCVDEKLVLATLTAHPREAARQHTALQVLGEVPLHIPGQATPHLARFLQQRGQVVSHRLIQHRPLRPPAPVLPPVLPCLPLPSHTSPGYTLLVGSHGPPPSPLWECRAGQSYGTGARPLDRSRQKLRVAGSIPAAPTGEEHPCSSPFSK